MKYVYFISFCKGNRVGNTEIETNYPIITIQSIRNIEKEIGRKLNEKNLFITDFILLRTED